MLKETVYFVNANSDEKFFLWQKYHKVISWEDFNSGYIEFVGFIKNDKDLPVYVDLFFSIINNELICFYSNSSNYNDSSMIEEYMDKYKSTCKNPNMYGNSTDSINFEKVLSYLKKDWWKNTEFDTENYQLILKKRE